MSKKFTIQEWVDLLFDAYEAGIMDDWDIQGGSECNTALIGMKDQPVILRSANAYWDATKKEWIQTESPIIVLPPGWDSWDGDREWIQIEKALRIGLGLREVNSDNKEKIEKERTIRFLDKPDPYGP